MNNLFMELFSIPNINAEVKKETKLANELNEMRLIILCPHYSINIQSKYFYSECDPEQIDWDWQDFESQLQDVTLSVNDYDDLVIEIFPDDFTDS